MDAKRNNYLLRHYGITEADYSNILQSQGGCCAICRRHHSEFKTRLAVDHDHKSGRVRGLLCQYDNHRVIGRHTDPDLLRRMADYVEKGTEFFVPQNRPVRRRKRKKT